MREQAAVLAPQLEHAAVFYRGTDEYLDAVLGFVAGGLERADPVFVAVPAPKVSLLREHLGGQAGRVSEWRRLLGQADRREPVDGGVEVGARPRLRGLPTARVAMAFCSSCSSADTGRASL